MASFSRGINIFTLPCSTRICLYQSNQLLLKPTRIQPFTTSLLRQYAAHAVSKTAPITASNATATIPATPKASTPTQAATPSPPKVLRTIQQTTSLGNIFKEPTLLYEAPPQRLLVLCSYTASFLLFIYGSYFALLFYYTPVDVNLAFKYGPLFITFCLYLASGWMFSGQTNLLRRVWAVPATKPGDGLRLRLEGRRWIPFATARLLVPADAVRVQSLLADVPLQPKAPHVPITEVSVLVRPFVRFGRFCRRVFENTQAAMFRNVFVHWHVSGQGWMNGAWKLDIRGMARGGAKGSSSCYWVLVFTVY